MIEGLLIVNGSMKTEKFETITAMYEVAAKQFGIQLYRCYNNEVVWGIDSIRYMNQSLNHKKFDFILFLDKDIRLAKMLESTGVRVFNSPEVIAQCDDKALTFMALKDKGIAMPKTICAPLVFEGMSYSYMDYIKEVEKEIPYPIVIKECFGSFGMQVYKVDSREELVDRLEKIGHKPHIYQAFVGSSYGKDVRIHVVGGQVVAAMLRASKEDFRANITTGGTTHVYNPPKAFKDLAIKVCDLIGADFAGVDLLFGQQGEPVLCEINSNAHIKTIYDCTGINVAEHMMAYIKGEVKTDG